MKLSIATVAELRGILTTKRLFGDWSLSIARDVVRVVHRDGKQRVAFTWEETEELIERFDRWAEVEARKPLIALEEERARELE